MVDHGIRYIGARYVPKFADPIEWSDQRTYEPLTIVTVNGASYTSKQSVPVGVPITDSNYWVITGNYNAQVESYRQIVETFDTRITTNHTDIVNVEQKNAAQDSDIASLADTITLNQGNIRDLGIRLDLAETDMQQNARDITQLRTDVETLQNAPSPRKSHIAFIGDSFSDGSGEVAQKLADNLGYQLINKAAAGAGFTTGSYRFGEQLADLIIDENFEDVEAIFVYGGVNDWNDAHSTVNAMQTAFSNFKSLWTTVPREKRPRLIFAFGNVGVTTQAKYDGFLQWVKDCTRLLRSSVGMIGVVDGVYQWLMGFNPSSVFNSDNLHPNDTGCRIIASYLASCFEGTYNGVYRQFEGSSSFGINATLTFTNGVIGVSVKKIDVALPNTSGYTQIASFGSRQLKFGGDNSSDSNQDFMTSSPLGVYVDSSGHTAQRQLVFNARNGNLYVQNFGTVSLIPTNEINIDTCLMGYPIS